MTAHLSQVPTMRARSALRNPLRLLVSPEPWLALLFMLLSFALGLFWFVTLVTLIAIGAGLSITLVGLPILAGTLVLWIYGARLERLRVRTLLGTPIATPYRPLPPGSMLLRLKTRVLDPHTWLDLLYLFLTVPGRARRVRDRVRCGQIHWHRAVDAHVLPVRQR